MYKGLKVLALIPARGGSKSIPRKNIKILGNKPLIAYTIEESLKSNYIDRIIVSTDDKEIATIAKEYGAEIPFLRPSKYAQDTSSSLSVVLHALNYLKKQEKYIPDIVVFLQPTSPFRKVKSIDEGIELIEDCDAVLGVIEVKNHPYFMFKKGKDNNLTPYLDLKDRPLRRQDLPTLYRINDALVIAKINYYKDVKETDPVAPIFKGRVKGIFMDAISSIDINEEFDFQLSEFILSYKKD